MIRRIIYCSLFILCCFSGVLYGQINHHESFKWDNKISEIKLEDGEFYSSLLFPEMVKIDSAGHPSLPVKYIRLIIPAGAEISDIIINNSPEIKIELKNKLEPVQYPVPISEDNYRPEFKKPEAKIYNSIEVYPENSVKVVDNGIFRQNKIVTLAIYPCSYLPADNMLLYSESIDFTLIYTLNSSKDIKQVKMKENRYSNNVRLLEHLVENKSDIRSYMMQAPLTDNETKGKTNIQLQDILNPSIILRPMIFVDCDYVIVTSNELASAFDEFMAWKRRKGIRIELVTMEAIRQVYTGDLISGINDDAGKLRQFLADAYNNGNGIEYVLLGGDRSVLPVKNAVLSANVPFDDKNNVPTDLYFADFDGNWHNNNGYYGEEGLREGIDFYPEVFIGRLLVSNIQEVNNWTRKVLKYEKNPGDGDYDYLTKVFFTQADEMQRDNQAGYILSYINWTTQSVVFNETGGYDTQSLPTFPKGKDVIDEFNKNYGLCSFMTHGNYNRIAVATTGMNESPVYGVFSQDNDSHTGIINESGNGFDNMTNVDHPSIYYSISCWTMPFDKARVGSGKRCMGTTFTSISNGGGPAYLGNTRNGFIQQSFGVFTEFVKVISSKFSFHIGIAEAISKLNYEPDKYIDFSHNLVGCPETEIWTATPLRFDMVRFEHMMFSNNVMIFTGVSGVNICVMSATDNGKSYYEVRENVSSSTFYNLPESYLITITKHNYIPYISDPNLYIQNESINTDRYIYGNNIYAGEIVTTAKPRGPAKILNGSNVTLQASVEVNLEGGFEIEKGAGFEIKMK